MDFIEANGDDRAISLRLLEPSLQEGIYARSEGLDWRPLVMTQLTTLSGARKTRHAQSTPRLRKFALFIKPLNNSPVSVAEQQAFWCKATGKSRASFFRLLAKHRSS